MQRLEMGKWFRNALNPDKFFEMYELEGIFSRISSFFDYFHRKVMTS